MSVLYLGQGNTSLEPMRVFEIIKYTTITVTLVRYLNITCLMI